MVFDVVRLVLEGDLVVVYYMLKNFRDLYNEGDIEENEDFDVDKRLVFIWEVVFVFEEFLLVFLDFVDVFFFLVLEDESIFFILELCDIGIFLRV